MLLLRKCKICSNYSKTQMSKVLIFYLKQYTLIPLHHFKNCSVRTHGYPIKFIPLNKCSQTYVYLIKLIPLNKCKDSWLPY